jgi:hypothetical protein
MWVEIFKTGVHTDSNGNTRTWSKQDLDHIASRYNPTVHEAPVVIGHPKENAPAYGWVESLKREGDTLFANLKDLVPEFVDLLKRKLYKKRSVSIYPDISLRHIGFLGAKPPAVKGLADIEFSDDNAITIDDPIYEDGQGMYSEAEMRDLIEKAKAEGEGRGLIKARTEYQEKERERHDQERKTTITTFVADKVKEGVIPPFLVDEGIVEFMEAIDEKTSYFEFGEGQRKNPVEWFMDFIENLERSPIFGEIATHGNAKKAHLKMEEELGKDIARKAESI